VLAWLIAQSPYIVFFPSTRTEAGLPENLGAQRLQLTVANDVKID